MDRLAEHEAARRRVFRVAELAAGLRALLEEEVGRVWVAGEVSNLHRAHSGHCYFTLKDDEAQIRAALFRGAAARIPFELEDGLQVIALGELSLYAARGDLQLIVRQLEPQGQGALQLAFEQLRASLEREGLFDEAHKRPLPRFPRRIGVVTSATGAAIRDVIHVSGLRFPAIPLLVAPTRVQGDAAEEEITRALSDLQRIDDVDVILLVRGGGSLEDLAPFNSERLARALRACRVPVVSGVGHEVDLTIADLAADARAPTPSAAAALALPDREAVAAQLARDRRRLAAAGASVVGAGRLRLAHAREGLRAQAPLARLATQRARFSAAQRALQQAIERHVERDRSRFGAATGRLGRAPTGVLEGGRRRLSSLAAELEALSPLNVLGRGYAIARRARDGAVIRRAAQVAPGDALRIRVHEGEIGVTVDSREPPGDAS